MLNYSDKIDYSSVIIKGEYICIDCRFQIKTYEFKTRVYDVNNFLTFHLHLE